VRDVLQGVTPLYDEEGEVCGYLVSFTDITELKELDSLRSSIVRNVSHELRTPLTFIRGYAELLLDEAMGRINERQRKSLSILKGKADTLARLIDDITSLRLIERESLNLEPLSLAEIARTSLAGIKPYAEKAGIEIVEEIPEGLPLVPGDRYRLYQVFDNLLSNAVKFSPDGGKVTVHIRDDGAYLRVEVSDTGIGIPKDKLKRIFERFYQVDNSLARRFGGMGLGLSITKQIVEAHGGEIWAESEVGRGSTFFFTLPKT
jgi:signal transduction histidine kinase